MMKGALLVLALLVTRELTFKTTEAEACPVFYGGVAALLLGSKTLLNSTLDLVDTTDEEKAAFGKAQDCFNEAGFDAKLKIVELVIDIALTQSPICTSVVSVPTSQNFQCDVLVAEAPVEASSENCSGYEVSSVVNALIGFNSSLLSMVT
ncbi:hypothetical protein MJT46_013335 [Ovis ammon polii x Ovis aries]|nr:hypothetical protein MJT46_013335 [Ovis ammon polii x Ovis aries]